MGYFGACRPPLVSSGQRRGCSNAALNVFLCAEDMSFITTRNDYNGSLVRSRVEVAGATDDLRMVDLGLWSIN